MSGTPENPGTTPGISAPSLQPDESLFLATGDTSQPEYIVTPDGSRPDVQAPDDARERAAGKLLYRQTRDAWLGQDKWSPARRIAFCTYLRVVLRFPIENKRDRQLRTEMITAWPFDSDTPVGHLVSELARGQVVIQEDGYVVGPLRKQPAKGRPHPKRDMMRRTGVALAQGGVDSNGVVDAVARGFGVSPKTVNNLVSASLIESSVGSSPGDRVPDYPRIVAEHELGTVPLCDPKLAAEFSYIGELDYGSAASLEDVTLIVAAGMGIRAGRLDPPSVSDRQEIQPGTTVRFPDGQVLEVSARNGDIVEANDGHVRALVSACEILADIDA